LAQDDYYYEIQLTNKQLVFYFMAGAAGLILSFLAGVMVGRSVEGPGAGAAEARPVVEEKVVAEQSPAPAAGAPGRSDYSYPKRLESDHPEEGLEGAGARPTPKPVSRPATPAPAARPTATPAATPTPPLPTPPARRAAPLPKALASTASGFAIQVGAFKDKGSAEGVAKSLKARGLPAYVLAPAGSSGGLFTVRVGVYRDRADAEVVADRLRDDKFKPYILKQ
jgi:cell division septation protein DedD